ncbi:putative secreted penicillin binding protein [Nostocoides australiense Ben110]|uniref:Putative secreted penicillin binding protein n=1 Tax=Nostocoides australiense Ben110 TaxID=1193182 RepID=W6K1N0_9MICO|nr:putative secreted penicillin binding protein [Tetrasphaera australiensis Ben110]
MRVSRALVLAIVGMLLLTAAGIGSFVWLRGDASDAERSARTYAGGVAQALADGTLPGGLEVADRAGAEQDYDEVLRGMGSLRPTVSVSKVDLANDERTGTVTFAQSWTIHEGKKPWTYTTTMPITRRGSGEHLAWTGTWSHAVIAPELTADERLSAVRDKAVRGDILAEDGTALVTLRPVVRVGIDKTLAKKGSDVSATAAALAEAVGIDPAAYRKAVTAAGSKAFVEAIVYRSESSDLAKLSNIAKKYPEMRLLEDELPLAPTSGFARPILGTVGPPTAEIIEKSAGRIRQGSLVGLSGLEAAQDQRLRGSDGFAVNAVQIGSDETRELYAVSAVDGLPVTVSLDEAVQEAAEAALTDVGDKGGASALVAIRPSDMHVLAAASGAGSQGYSTSTLGQYPPGSTFKAVTALALLRSGLTPKTKIDCTKTATVEGRAFKNYDDYPPKRLGSISLTSAIANSCNTALISQLDRLDGADLAEAAAALGLTAQPQLGVPGALGTVPADAAGVDLAASLIGQGRVVTSPMGMATVAASIARGSIGAPVIVIDGREPKPSPPSKPLTRKESEELQALLRAVVTDGSASFLKGVPGDDVLAKTGTAEYGRGDPPPTHAWMIGIQGDVAVAVFVEKGQSGAKTAGPILEEFLRRMP